MSSLASSPNAILRRKDFIFPYPHHQGGFFIYDFDRGSEKDSVRRRNCGSGCDAEHHRHRNDRRYRSPLHHLVVWELVISISTGTSTSRWIDCDIGYHHHHEEVQPPGTDLEIGTQVGRRQIEDRIDWTARDDGVHHRRGHRRSWAR